MIEPFRQDWRDRNRGGWESLLPHFIEAARTP